MEPNPPLTDLITSLEQATLLAKQLPSITDPTQFLQLYSSLQTTNHQLTSFLNLIPQASSAINGDQEEPMQIGDDDPDEESSMVIVIDKVEERLRNCNIQNKRRKRPLSPTSVAVEQRGFNGSGGDNEMLDQGFDPHGTRLRSVELVFQFHA
ncbi:hypothetical protein ACHQM5_000881 [Ranunculus cassubicifolius]